MEASNSLMWRSCFCCISFLRPQSWVLSLCCVSNAFHNGRVHWQVCALRQCLQETIKLTVHMNTICTNLLHHVQRACPAFVARACLQQYPLVKHPWHAPGCPGTIVSSSRSKASVLCPSLARLSPCKSWPAAGRARTVQWPVPSLLAGCAQHPARSGMEAGVKQLRSRGADG